MRLEKVHGHGKVLRALIFFIDFSVQQGVKTTLTYSIIANKFWFGKHVWLVCTSNSYRATLAINSLLTIAAENGNEVRVNQNCLVVDPEAKTMVNKSL